MRCFLNIAELTIMTILKYCSVAAGSAFIGYVYGNCDTELRPLISRVQAASALIPSTPFGATGGGGNVMVPSQAVPQQPSVSRASEIMKYGYPGFDNLRTFEDFVLSYDRRNRTVHWVFEHLTPDRMKYSPDVNRDKCAFTEDESVHKLFRSNNNDYKGSGFDRGHMAAAGNHRRSQNSIQQTFLLSNMAPQVGKGFNRDKWNDLEQHVRRQAKNNTNVYVCTGPLYLPRVEPDGKMYVRYQVIGKQHVSVPTHFFKVLLVEGSDGKFRLESYVLPNQPIPNETHISNFYAPLESVERAAGILMFDKLPKNLLSSINGKRP